MQKQFLLLILISLGCVVLTGKQLHQRADRLPSASPKTDQTIIGDALEGVTFDTLDNNGNTLKLTIADVELDPTDPDQETYLYTVLYADLQTSQWQNLCHPDREGKAQAIPLSGQWDERGNHVDNDQITFACTNGVLAKCVRWGYKPWKTVNRESLRDYHQACTRMARADYCGNGNSHTQDGTLIDIYDRLNIQQPTHNNGMVFEAAWSPEGAVQLHRTRYPDTIAQLQQECPEKLQAMWHRESEPSVTDIELHSSDALLFNRSLDVSNDTDLVP